MKRLSLCISPKTAVRLCAFLCRPYQTHRHTGSLKNRPTKNVEPKPSPHFVENYFRSKILIAKQNTDKSSKSQSIGSGFSCCWSPRNYDDEPAAHYTTLTCNDLANAQAISVSRKTGFFLTETNMHATAYSIG